MYSRAASIQSYTVVEILLELILGPISTHSHVWIFVETWLFLELEITTCHGASSNKMYVIPCSQHALINRCVLIS